MLTLLVTAGCGAARYEERLQNTAEYFAYKEKLNQSLGADWQMQGVRIRPPKQFREISPPAPVAGADGDVTGDESVIDPRQPADLGVNLPGLLGAWQADVHANVAGADESRTAHLYILGNHERFLEGPDDAGFSDVPEEFLTDVENLISGLIGVILPEGEGGDGTQQNMRYRETAPQVEKFARKKDYTAIRFKPEIAVDGFDIPTELQLYEWRGQKIQVAVLLIYPTSISPQEKLHERMLLALETFEASDTPPRSVQGGDAPATAAPSF